MKIFPMSLGPIQTNCYIISENQKAFIIDPGAEAEKIIKHLSEQNLTPTAILLTHGHFDHIAAVDEVAMKYDLPVYAHSLEKEYFFNPKFNFSYRNGGDIVLSEALNYNWLTCGDTLELIDLKFKILHVPGHSLGSICFYDEDRKVIFTGDTLFRGSIGRTDFLNGNMEQLHAMISQKLLTLPEDTVVYPGHGSATTIRDEKLTNPFFR